ncbi:hypothetical protein WP12_03535 [Sphingomonas sp. SRS2]|nr:hypothetical protein WP12_03535 [Sphingomonas sp. SRS2]
MPRLMIGPDRERRRIGRRRCCILPGHGKRRTEIMMRFGIAGLESGCLPETGDRLRPFAEPCVSDAQQLLEEGRAGMVGIEPPAFVEQVAMTALPFQLKKRVDALAGRRGAGGPRHGRQAVSGRTVKSTMISPEIRSSASRT